MIIIYRWQVQINYRLTGGEITKFHLKQLDPKEKRGRVILSMFSGALLHQGIELLDIYRNKGSILRYWLI